LNSGQRLYPWGQHGLAFVLYVILIWGVAYLRKDFLWIDGDDPNLLQQSLLINAGFIPNVDFFSGYPGLSLYIQAIFTQLAGATPLSQHLYTATQATMLGVVFFWAARRCAPALVLLVLIFVYAQGMFLNPTPNPGYLFEIGFILGLKKTWDYLQYQDIRSAFLAGAAFSVAFLSKQYGMFGPVSFFLSTLALLGISPRWRNVLFVGSLSIIGAAILFSYFGSVILHSAYGVTGEIMGASERLNLLLKNSTVFVAPLLAGLLTYLIIKQTSAAPRIGLRPFILSNLAVLSSFLFLSTAYLGLQYGRDVLQVIEEIMILAPKRINSYLVDVSFSTASLVRAGYGLLVFSVFIFAFMRSKRPPSNRLYFALFVLLAVLVVKGANLSATPFLTLAYLMVSYELSRRIDTTQAYSAMALLISLTPLFLILIPYPNFAYHLPLLAFVLLLVSPSPREYVYSAGSRRGHAMPYLLATILVGIVLVKVDRDMGSHARFVFGQVTFLSGDPRWHDAIAEAKAVKQGGGGCSTYGCRYLLLTDPSFSDYGLIIEKPIHQR
jgi:hypothetical protein